MDTGHLCLCPASLDPGRVTRVGREPRHCPGEARGEGGPAGKREVSGGATASSHGSRARSQPEPGGITIVFGEHINPRADPRAPRFPPGGHSVSSEALYRGPGPGLRREVRVRSGLPVSERLSPSGLCNRRRPGGERGQFLPRAEGLRRAGGRGEQEEDPLLRGFPDASSSSRRAPGSRPRLRGEGGGERARRRGPPGCCRDWSGGGPRWSRRGAGEGGARARARGCAPRAPAPHPRGLRPPRTGVWSRSRRRVAAPGTWRPTHCTPPFGPECTDPPSLLSSFSAPLQEGGAPESPLQQEGPRGPGRAGLEQRRRPPEPSLQRGTD